MSRFLKLSNLIINKNFIHSIDINKDTIIIHLMTNKTQGLFIYWVGFLDSSNTKIELCKIKNLSDYEKVSEWIASKEYL